jgi:hypothetical protein
MTAKRGAITISPQMQNKAQLCQNPQLLLKTKHYQMSAVFKYCIPQKINNYTVISFDAREVIQSAENQYHNICPEKRSRPSAEQELT